MKFLIYYLLVKEIIYRGEIDRDIRIYLRSCRSFIWASLYYLGSLCPAVQTSDRGKTLSKCAKAGLLWLKWFPLDLPHSLQLSDFNQWQFSPHV